MIGFQALNFFCPLMRLLRCARNDEMSPLATTWRSNDGALLDNDGYFLVIARSAAGYDEADRFLVFHISTYKASLLLSIKGLYP